MKRKWFATFSALLMCCSSIFSQTQQLPIDKKLRTGKLENGLTYYVYHNDFIPNRANFFIVQNVGSILEMPNQRGLAHFLEHMAFNGTKNFPDKKIISFLETIGVKFGSNLNAYTSVDETVYHIHEVPTNIPGVVDTCLMILRDWADGITLNDAEIDNERGVIEEEWRSRDNYMLRMYEQILPEIYAKDKYKDCMPIGNINVIRNFKYDELRDYYKKWYRPDLQGIIVVGDVDADKVEQQIRTIFASCKKDADAPDRIWYEVSDNSEPTIVYTQDKEATEFGVVICTKKPKFPDSKKNTLLYYAQSFTESVVDLMINYRLTEILQKPNAPFSNAIASTGDFFLSQKRKSHDLEACYSENQAIEALKTLLTERERIVKYGFTNSEYERAKAIFLKDKEKLYNERDKQKNDFYSWRFVSNFTEGYPLQSIEQEFAIYQQVAQNLPLEAINQMIQSSYNSIMQNSVIWFAGPESTTTKFPTKDEVISLIKSVEKMAIEPYEEKFSNEPLIQNLPEKGSVKSKREMDYGITEYILSNGVKVWAKPTNFKTDEIRFMAYSKGGYGYEDIKNAETLQMLNDIASVGGLGNFSAIELNKVLAGKNVNVAKKVGVYDEQVSGISGVNDLETMFQLFYLHFTDVRRDDEAFTSLIQRYHAILHNIDLSPNIELLDSITSIVYNNNVYEQVFREKSLDNVDYEKGLEILKNRFANAADFNFMIVGNAPEEVLIPLLEQYIATLPANGKKETYINTGDVPVKGDRKVHYYKYMTNPKTIAYIVKSGKMPYTLESRIHANMLNQILNIVYFEKIREDKGGTYGVRASYTIDKAPFNRYALWLGFETDESKVNDLIPIIYNELEDIAKNGPRETDLQKVKEYMTKVYTDNQIENNYWLEWMIEYGISGIDIENKHLQVVQNTTAKDIQKFMKLILKKTDTKEIIQIGK